MNITNNLEKLIKEISLKKIDFYVISTNDENLLEYTPDQNKRLQWLTNFSGSNGIALISKKKKFFFTDGRYILQAKKEIDSKFKIIDLQSESFFLFFQKNIQHKTILIDYRIFNIKFVKELKRIAELNSVKIYHDKKNIIDKIWDRKIKKSQKHCFFLEKKISGEDTLSKKERIFNKIDYDFLILTSSESICWLMNLRGFDLEHTPVVICRAIVTKNTIKLFTDLNKFPRKVKVKGVQTFCFEEFEAEILKLPKNKKLALNSSSSYFYYELIKSEGLKLDLIEDPCINVRCKKNQIEIKHSIKYHISDGVSLVKFFYWLENSKFTSDLDEVNVSRKLEDFRKQNKNYFSSSFPTISAFGKNASVIHYNPVQNNKRLISGQLFLCDSGAQYLGATTDVTRTIFIGGSKPKKEYILNYTRVLQGHINLAMIKFPRGTRGHQIDSLARYSLWQNGLDYSHGTGHGVGSFLGVHEGPQSISKNFNKSELKEGMVLSNEPGYYKSNCYGIRIENLLLIIPSKYKGFLEFKNLTLCPYEKNLIDLDLLTDIQKKWINRYHSDVYNKLKKYLKQNEKSWLFKKTQHF